MNKKLTAVSLVLVFICLATERIAYSTGTSAETPAVPVTGSRKPTQIKVYLVALADNGKSGKKIGCDDSLVAVTQTKQ
jgi:hypothetical protein